MTQAQAIATAETKAVEGEVLAPTMTQKQFDKHLENITKAGKNLAEAVQVAGMYAINQAAVHNNYDAFFKVYSAIATGLNVRSANQFRLWAESFAPVKFVLKDGIVVKARLSKSENAATMNQIGASETPWNKVEGFTGDETADVVNKLFTADKAIDRLTRMVDSMKKVIEKGEFASETDRLAIPAMLEKVEAFKAELEKDINDIQPTQAKAA